MNNKLCSRLPARAVRSSSLFPLLLAVLAGLSAPAPARANAPDWMHTAAAAQLPKYAAETSAVLLYDETIVTVKDSGEIHYIYRRAYRILRPNGRDRGTVPVLFDNETKLLSLKAWCFPAGGGKEYEVKDKDALETQITEDVLFSDLHAKLLTIPAADPGAVVGYEYEQRARPNILQDTWWIQHRDPVRQERFVLQLPPGWRYKANWVLHAPVEVHEDGNNQLHWDLSDIPPVAEEPAMPPAQAIEGRMILNYFPATTSSGSAFDSWQDIGKWYTALSQDRRADTPEIKQKVTELTASSPDALAKMRALAAFVQKDIRYVAIEIGIGGYQPHAAASVFSNRFGDCKDKATLMSTMLHDIGVDSYYVMIHSRRGVIEPDYPPAVNFNHAILAIKIPADVPTTNLYATIDDAQLGKLLFFDPTSELTPFGYLPAELQKNYGLLVTPTGGELVALPLLPPATNRLIRTAQLTLTVNGTLSGVVKEIRWGDSAEASRATLLNEKAGSRSKVLEDFLANFLGGFTLTAASTENLDAYDKTLVVDYSFTAQNYAQMAGNLLLVRPRVMGDKGSQLLEDKERKYPVEFDAATLQTDEFDITIPPGFVPDELPPPTNLDFEFGSYNSKCEVAGNVMRYTRTFELKDVFVPTQRLAELKSFYHQIAVDENRAAVLKRVM